MTWEKIENENEAFWNISVGNPLRFPFSVAVVPFLNVMTMLWDRIMSREIKSSWSIFALIVCCFVLCSSCWAHVEAATFIFISFESILNELFMAANIPPRLWIIKNESEGMLLLKRNDFLLVFLSFACSTDDWKGGNYAEPLTICWVLSHDIKQLAAW